MMKADDIKDLSPKQIKNKFDLPGPGLPTHVVNVKPLKDMNIRTGTVNKGNFTGKGGGQQFQFLQKELPPEMFTNPKPLK